MNTLDEIMLTILIGIVLIVLATVCTIAIMDEHYKLQHGIVCSPCQTECTVIKQ